MSPEKEKHSIYYDSYDDFDIENGHIDQTDFFALILQQHSNILPSNTFHSFVNFYFKFSGFRIFRISKCLQIKFDML